MRKRGRSFFGLRKNGIITEYLPWLIIGLAVLAIIFVAILMLKDTGIGFIDKIKGVFRGR